MPLGLAHSLALTGAGDPGRRAAGLLRVHRVSPPGRRGPVSSSGSQRAHARADKYTHTHIHLLREWLEVPGCAKVTVSSRAAPVCGSWPSCASVRLCRGGRELACTRPNTTRKHITPTHTRARARTHTHTHTHTQFVLLSGCLSTAVRAHPLQGAIISPWVWVGGRVWVRGAPWSDRCKTKEPDLVILHPARIPASCHSRRSPDTNPSRVNRPFRFDQ